MQFDTTEIPHNVRNDSRARRRKRKCKAFSQILPVAKVIPNEMRNPNKLFHPTLLYTTPKLSQTKTINSY